MSEDETVTEPRGNGDTHHSRFSDRAQDYQVARPRYDPRAVDFLMSEEGLGSTAETGRIADVGSGTGILSGLLLQASNEVVVYGVEPNLSMRTEAERVLGGDARFVSVEGSAEATGLNDDSVDAITVAQAFHWFDVERTRTEFERVLRGRGKVALIWNIRSEDADDFHRDYEQYLRDFAPGYLEVRETWMVRHRLDRFFSGQHERRQFGYRHVLDADGLRSRLLSSSYAPKATSGSYDSALGELDSLFERHQKGGTIPMIYACECYCGQLG